MGGDKRVRILPRNKYDRWMFLIFTGVILTVFLMFSGCTPSTGIARFEQFDAAAEVETDAILEFTVKRLCSLPIDILARNAAESSDTAKGMYYLCDPVRNLVFSILGAIGQGGMDVNVEMTPIE